MAKKEIKETTVQEPEIEIKVDNGGITPEQIGRWKAQHRKVYEITLDDDGELLSGYFHRPDMETMTAVTKLTKTDEIKGAEALFANCWLGGAQLIQEEATLKFATLAELNKVLKVTRAEIKNL